MNKYTLHANKFLEKNNVRFSVSYIGESIPDWDNNYHSEYRCRFYNRSSKKSMTVNFFQSLVSSGTRPTAYDVLACLTKYDVGSIDNFVSEFGYEVNSWKDVKKIEKTYKAVVREWKNVQRVFGNCLEELQEIA